MKNKELDMLHGNLIKDMLIFAMPLIAVGVLQLLFNAADVAVVGKFAGDVYNAAVSATITICFLANSLAQGFATGANVYISKNYGAKNYDEVRKGIHTSLAVGPILGVIFIVIMYLSGPTLLTIMHTPEEIFDLARTYLNILSLSYPFAFTYFMCAAILRTKGDTQSSFKYLSAAGVLNVALNLLFVIVFKLHVIGVSTATVISQIFSLILILRHLSREEGILKINKDELKIDPKILVNIITIGLPAGIQGSMMSISNMFIQSSINLFGTAVIAANGNAGSISGIIVQFDMGVTTACTTFIATCYGAKDYKRVLKIMYTTLIMNIILTAVVGIGLYVMGRPILSLYTSSEEVITYGLYRLLYYGCSFPLCSIMDSFSSSLRGIGSSVKPMLVSIFVICGIRILWLKTVFVAYPTLDNIYVTFPLSWLIADVTLGIMFAVTYKKVCHD